MLNLFSKKTEQELIAEIHNEFDTAETRLLEQSESLLKYDNDSLLKKAEQLSRLGFTNAEPVTKANKLNLVHNKEQAELIKYYQQNYPFQKFITEDELERICKKYNLIFAPVANYTKDVPQKNINEIEKAPMLKVLDSPSNKVWCELDYSGSINIGNYSAMEQGLPRRIEDKNFKGWVDADEYLKKLYSPTSKYGYLVSKVRNFNQSKDGLYICAPKSNFNLTGLKKTGTFSFGSVFVTEVKDPIVFRYVRGGVQILSKWGLEANDEDLVNPTMN